MKLAVIGTGYVGLVSAVCFAELGYQVSCIDRDEAKIAKLSAGEPTIWEMGLKELLTKNQSKLHFTSDLAVGIKDADIIFVAVGTPPLPDSDLPDLSAIETVFTQLAGICKEEQLVVIKSTVPVGTCARMEEYLHAQGCKARVASNPEFLREGSAIGDFMQPDRVVAGVSCKADKEKMMQLYAPLTDQNVTLFLTTLQSSELIKYTANSLLALRVAYINEIADICETMGANIRDVAIGIGMDRRIGPHFLKPGPGIGGSCFPKDTQALTALARHAGAPATIIEAAIKSNNIRKKRMVEKVIRAAGGSVDGSVIGVLGLTFKPNTDDMRESPAIDIVNGLQAAGAKIQAYDPEGMEQAREIFTGITFANSAINALTGADICVIITEWGEFVELMPQQIRSAMRGNLVVDLRNIYKRKTMQAAGFDYISIGRQAVTGKQQEVRDLLAV